MVRDGLVLGVALAALFSVPGQRGAQSSLHATCVWQSGEYQGVLDGLMSCGDDNDEVERANTALRDHARRHGWVGSMGGLDLVAPENNVQCPRQVLDLLLQVTTACADGEASWLQIDFADVLARNGRIDDALAVLEVGQAGSRPRSVGWDPGWWARADRSFAAASAARIAAEVGRWEDALRFSEEWVPTGGCGNCMAGESARIAGFRADCLLQLHRWNEVRTLCIDHVDNSWSFDACLAERWIDSYVLSNEITDPSIALELLTPFAESGRAEELQIAERHWRLLHMPRTEQLEHLPEVAGSHSRTALELVLSVDAASVERWLGAYAIENGELRDFGMAYLLAKTGLAAVGEAIEKAEAAAVGGRAAETLKWVKDSWTNAHDQRDLLAKQ